MQSISQVMKRDALTFSTFARQCVGMTVSQFERELRRRRVALPRSAGRRRKSLRMLGLAAERGRLVLTTVTRCPTRNAARRLTWAAVPHPTRNLPLYLGVVGRW